MRRVSGLKLVSLVALTMAISLVQAVACVAGASDDAVATAWQVAKAPAVDGDLSEWNLSSPLVLEDESQVIRDVQVWGGPQDLSAHIYVMWDEANLYLGAVIKEDTAFSAAEMLPIEHNDNITLYLSTDPKADLSRTAYVATDFKVVLVIDDNLWDTGIDRSMIPMDQKGEFYSCGMEGGEDVLPGYQRAAKASEGGFTFEAAIPWKDFANANLPAFVPKSGDTIRFDVALTDINYP